MSTAESGESVAAVSVLDRKVFDLLRAEDMAISREGLQVVKKRHWRRVLGATTQWVRRACYLNPVWSYEFVFDQTDDGRRLTCLTVVDEFTRQGLTIEIGRSLTAGDVVRILEKLFQQFGRPVYLHSDSGPEKVSGIVQKWLQEKRVDTHYIEPGSRVCAANCVSATS